MRTLLDVEFDLIVQLLSFGIGNRHRELRIREMEKKFPATFRAHIGHDPDALSYHPQPVIDLCQPEVWDLLKERFGDVVLERVARMVMNRLSEMDGEPNNDA